MSNLTPNIPKLAQTYSGNPFDPKDASFLPHHAEQAVWCCGRYYIARDGHEIYGATREEVALKLRDAMLKKTYSGTKVRLKQGTYGPRHDPYGRSWLTVERWGKSFEFYCGGLGDSSIKVDDKPHELDWGQYDNEDDAFEACVAEFKQLTGYTPNEWIEWMHVAESRCSHCGCTRLRWMKGYPGEELGVCVRCGEVGASYFDESAII